MSQLNDEQVMLIEQTINQYLKDHFSNFKENAIENNKSFMFLEKNSLNMLLSYLMFMTKNNGVSIEKENLETTKLLSQLEELIQVNKREFESLIEIFDSISQRER